MKTITLTKDNMYSYRTVQKGYGRQGLYVELHNLEGCSDKEVYVKDVFPNVVEHFDITTEDNAFYDEVSDSYHDGNGNVISDCDIFDTIFDGVVHHLDGIEVEVEEEN